MLLKVVLYNYLNIKTSFIFINNYICLIKLVNKYFFNYYSFNKAN